MSGTAQAPEAHATTREEPNHHGESEGSLTSPREAPITETINETITMDGAGAIWRDVNCSAADRVADLMGRMTLEEKVAQLYSVWIGGSVAGDDLAPHQHDLADDTLEWSDIVRNGLGQLTRPFGTAPVTPTRGIEVLARMQTEIIEASRLGIPALAHEECLTGLMTWGATVYPTPLAWGASFDPDLVEQMAVQIGEKMRMLGMHQGLAPVLDVVRDPRWGRTEETIGEDPYLVGTVGTAYVRGLESTGIVSTLKHFVGYSASRAGRNFGPVSIGPRELNDVLLFPFELAVREGGARSVMHSYAEIDGMPAAASVALLTTLLRDEWGFAGTVVADYFGVTFLEMLHHIAGSAGEAAALALAAGVDVELPAVRCYGPPLLAAIQSGVVPESLVDRSLRRVLTQKCELGLLDPGWTPVRGVFPDDVLDPPEARALARKLAEESVVLLANGGALPLAPQARVAMIGAQADDVLAMQGCYTFPSHVGTQHPQVPAGVAVPTLLEELRARRSDVRFAVGCGVSGDDTSGIAEAAELAADAEVCVAVLGDRAGLFGKGTSGEGSDAADLDLPGMQRELLEALLATGTPVVLVLLSGRPYALGAYHDRLAAVVQAFFPGEEGGAAVADVLTGQVCPSGRLPLSMPRHPGGQPSTYLAPALGHRTEVSSIDPTPLYPFGFGLSYTQFSWDEVAVDGAPTDGAVVDGSEGGSVDVATDGSVTVSLTVRNIGDRAGADVVQLYLHDPVAQVTRPVVRLIGYARVALAPGEAQRVSFEVPADVTCFTGRDGTKLVEPGALELRLAASCVDVRHTVRVRLTGPERVVGHDRRYTTDVRVG